MKNKYIDIIFMGILSCILMSLFFLTPTLIDTMSTQEKKLSESPAFIEANTVMDKEADIDTILIREKYDQLISVLIDLKSKGLFTADDISKIHKSIGDYESNIPTEVPYTDKDLLEYLYDNNIITKAQFEQILDLMDEND